MLKNVVHALLGDGTLQLGVPDYDFVDVHSRTSLFVFAIFVARSDMISRCTIGKSMTYLLSKLERCSFGLQHQSVEALNAFDDTVTKVFNAHRCGRTW
jgi:hypothetical protein